MTKEKRTSGTDEKVPPREKEPRITYGNWSSTSDLYWSRGNPLHDDPPVLMQKFRRRVRRDWGGGCYSRSYEYSWMPVPQKEGAG